MAMIGKVLRMHHREKKSVREIVKATSLARNTVRKYLRIGKAEPPKYRRPAVPTKLAPFVEAVQRALLADARRPKKERRTARALLAQIEQSGYEGGYSRLTDYIRQWRNERGGVQVGDAYVPLSFELGEAFQFDWSEEPLVIGGQYQRLQVAHMKLCASRAFWEVAYPSQGHEMLFDAHTRSFAALGGVARRGIYDLHVDGRGPGGQGQDARCQRALRHDVCPLPVRCGLLQRRLGLGEGGCREERAGQPPAHLAGGAGAALQQPGGAQRLAG
jgi:transposase